MTKPAKLLKHGLGHGPALAVVAALTLTSSALGVDAFRQLNGTEIKARFSGKELTDGVHWSMRFGNGGKLTASEAVGRFAPEEKAARAGRGGWSGTSFASTTARGTRPAIRSGCPARTCNCAGMGRRPRTAPCTSKTQPGTDGGPMKRICAVLLFTGLGLGLSAAAQAADAFRQLKGSEIKARFAGMELGDGVHWAYVFARDGRTKSFSMGKPGAYT